MFGLPVRSFGGLVGLLWRRSGAMACRVAASVAKSSLSTAGFPSSGAMRSVVGFQVRHMSKRRVQVVMRESAEKIGVKGQVLEVRPGYARNYLLPNRLAAYASEEHLAAYKVEGADAEADRQKKMRTKKKKALQAAERAAAEAEGGEVVDAQVDDSDADSGPFGDAAGDVADGADAEAGRPQA